MKDYIKQISLKPLILGFIILLVGVNTGVTIFLFSSFQNQGVAIDVAGRNRMLSQRMVLYAGIYLEENKPEAKTRFEDALKLHDMSLKRLKEGGKAPGIKAKFLDAPSGEPASRIIQIESTWHLFRDNAQKILDLPLYQASSQKKSLNPEVVKAYRFLKENSNTLLQLNNELVQAYVRQGQAQMKWLYLWLCISVLIMLYVSYKWMERYFLNPIQEIVQATHKVSIGNYEQKISSLGRNEFGTLAEALNNLFFKFQESAHLVKEMGRGNFQYKPQIPEEFFQSDSFLKALTETQNNLQIAHLEDKNRNWMNEGYAKFSTLLQSENSSLEETAKIFLTNLIEYLNANIGGVFILRNDPKEGDYLELLASYAYDRNKFIQMKVLPGEGLVGEIFLEGISKRLTELPIHYAQIACGLHEIKPDTLVLVPLKSHTTCLGVLEISSVAQIDDFKIDFLERVGQMFAGTLSNRFQNEETQRLYQEAQEMTEKLQSSEEEMRQNMEELQTTQELMRRKEMEYVKVIEKFKQEKTEKPLDKGMKDTIIQN